MASQKLRMLSTTLYTSQRKKEKEGENMLSVSLNRRKVHSLRQSAKQKYIQLTDRSRQQQKSLVRSIKSGRTPQWKYDYYKINQTFSLFPQENMQPFPHNNRKYNIQFLQKTLRGGTLNFPVKDTGYFQKPTDVLLSQHYKPIVDRKRQFNQTYQLRTSMFGDTWVDIKKDHIIDEYKLQANPFRTPVSNTLISTMHKQKDRWHKL